MKKKYKPRREKIPLHNMWIRGAIGKQFVIKRYKGGKVIRTKFPDMSRIIASTWQRNCRNLFKEAVAYAKKVIADPVEKKEWQKRIKRRNGVYNKAIRAFMIREKHAMMGEELLAAQQVRVVNRNETKLVVNPTQVPVRKLVVEKTVESYSFLETG